MNRPELDIQKVLQHAEKYNLSNRQVIFFEETEDGKKFFLVKPEEEKDLKATGYMLGDEATRSLQ